jgi:hypothetical protein
MTARARLQEDLIRHVFEQFHAAVGRAVQLFGSQAEVDVFLATLYGRLLSSLAQQLIADSKLLPEQKMMLLTIYLSTVLCEGDVREMISMKGLGPEIAALTERMNGAMKHVVGG